MKTEIMPIEGNNVEIISIGNERWVLGNQLGYALGFANPKESISNLWRRHKAEFTEETTIVVELPGPAGPRLTRLFNSRGVKLICMKAQTPRAELIRVRMLDILEGKAEPALPPPAPALSPPTPARLPTLIRDYALRGQPKLRRLAVLRRAGLTHAEIGKVLGWSAVAVNRNLRVAEALGLIDPPADLARRQAVFARVRARKGQATSAMLPAPGTVAASEVSHG